MSTATLTNTIADAATQMQDKASEAFRAGRTATADGMKEAAARINAGGDRVADIAHSTADSLKSGSKYVRKLDPSDMADDVVSLIKAHPGKALLGAAILGFFAGRAFRRD